MSLRQAFLDALSTVADLVVIALFIFAILAWLPASEREHRQNANHHYAQQMER